MENKQTIEDNGRGAPTISHVSNRPIYPRRRGGVEVPDMDSHPNTPAFRTPRIGLLLATACALLLVAAPANALPALPSIEQGIDTAAGRVDASAGAHGANACYDLATPALPALPAVPTLPVPVQVPAVPNVSAQADSCVSAGLDGVSYNSGIDTPLGRHEAGIDADAPISQDEVEAMADETTGEAKGFLDSLIDTLFGWM